MKGQMRKRDKKVEIPLHGQQRRCLQIIADVFEGTGVTAEKLRKYVNDKPQRIRSYLSDLVTEGYLDGDSFLLTEKGRAAYETQQFWKEELIWWMEKLSVPRELIEGQAELFLDTMEPEVIRRIYIQNEYIRTLERNCSSQETFNNSDLSGKLLKGTYRAKIVFLDPGNQQGDSGYSQFSSLNQYFSSQAELIVEPLKSRLILNWEPRYGSLEEAVYLWEEKERRRESQEGRLSIPVADLNFIHVRTYGILEGKLDMTVKFKSSEGAEQAVSTRLLVSLPINGKK